MNTAIIQSVQDLQNTVEETSTKKQRFSSDDLIELEVSMGQAQRSIAKLLILELAKDYGVDSLADWCVEDLQRELKRITAIVEKYNG